MSVILNTKLRRKLLIFSFTHPNENYYVRELSSLIDEDPGNLSRELRKLEEEGLFASFTRGRAKFYSLNKEYPLFKEIKKIVTSPWREKGKEESDMGRKAQDKQRDLKLISGKVKARKCRHCGHHEIGIVTKAGKFIALKQGDKVVLVNRWEELVSTGNNSVRNCFRK
jgi:DNA-binding transcriptional ArsR family regulator